MIKQVFSILFALCLAVSSMASHADDTLAFSNTNEIVPEWLPSGRDIRIELIPDAASNPATPSNPADTEGTSAAVVTADTPPGDVWTRIRSGFALQPLASKPEAKLVAKHEKWYASHPDYVERMTERAKRYLFYITEEVERRGMPTEIALLPMIESAFNPDANSSANASGIWQFMPTTGRNFGLQQNWWVDGRRDIIGATNSALDYLQKLHDQFGDWELALAAYNWGENGVARAQARNRKHHKPTDYASLRMPRETRNYVPKLLAIKNIISDPAQFGLTLNEIPDEPYFEAVATSQHIDVKLAAELADVSMDEFTALNPGLNRPVILQDTTNVILLPVDKVDTFRSNLEKTNQRLVSWQPYESKRGERFADIAERFGLTFSELRAANGFSKYAKESNGQTLLVPITDDGPATEFTAFNMHPGAMTEMLGTVRYTVHRGDTISTIARRFHVSQAQLIEANHGRTFLRVGQHFNIVLADHTSHRHHRAETEAFKNPNIHKTKGVSTASGGAHKDI